MIEAWDAYAVDYVPVKNYNKLWSIFLKINFLLGFLMVFNTFFWILIEQFNSIKESLSPYRGMTKD